MSRPVQNKLRVVCEIQNTDTTLMLIRAGYGADEIYKIRRQQFAISDVQAAWKKSIEAYIGYVGFLLARRLVKRIL